MDDIGFINQVDQRKKQNVFLKYLIIACIVSAANVLFCFNRTASYTVIACEVVFLIYILLVKNLAEYVSYFMIFMCNCIEFAVFTGEETFFSFKNFRIFGFNLGIIMLLPVFVIGFTSLFGEKRKKSRGFNFVRGLVIINVVAFVVGLLLIMINDNNIRSLGGIARAFINEAYSMMFLPMAFVVAFAVIKRRCIHKMYEIGLAIQATLWATTFQMLVSLAGGLAGSYGVISTLQGSILNFFIPLLIIYRFFQEDVVFPRTTTIVGLVGSLLALTYNANGKIILLFGICLVIYWWYAFKRGSIFIRAFSLVAIVALVCSIPFVIPRLRQNALFNAKFGEVERLVNIFSSNWLDELNMSARVRVEEIRDVFIEYSKKPLLAITGKGYLGSILDHTGFFATNITSSDGFVSDTEFVHRIYYALHEGARYLIMYGGIGVVFMIRFIADAVKRLKRKANVPLFIGAYWFVLFYGYSFTLSTFGIICLLYAYQDTDDELLELIDI